MVVNDKALLRQMKEAYKNQGYTVAVQNDLMVVNSGFWLAQINVENVPNEVLSLITLHTRKVLDNGDAYKVVKGDDGPIVQKRLIDDALGGIEELEKELETRDFGQPCMKKTALRYDGCSVWQTTVGLDIFLIDPRYEALITSSAVVSKVGNGIYAEGQVSKVWVLRVAVKGSDADNVQHLAQCRWVEA